MIISDRPSQKLLLGSNSVGPEFPIRSLHKRKILYFIISTHIHILYLIDTVQISVCSLHEQRVTLKKLTHPYLTKCLIYNPNYYIRKNCYAKLRNNQYILENIFWMMNANIFHMCEVRTWKYCPFKVQIWGFLRLFWITTQKTFCSINT